MFSVRQSVAGLALAFLLFSPGLALARSAPELVEKKVRTEEYAVLSSLIGTFLGSNTFVETVVLSETTSIEWNKPDILDFVRHSIPEVSDDTVKDFKRRNRQKIDLERQLDLHVAYVLLPEEEIREIFTGVQGWQTFYERFPKSQGLMTVSRVGFNQAKNQALVYVGNQVGPLGGEGVYLFLRKENGQWRSVAEVSVWIS